MVLLVAPDGRTYKPSTTRLAALSRYSFQDFGGARLSQRLRKVKLSGTGHHDEFFSGKGGGK